MKEAARELRSRATPSERVLWEALRGGRFGVLKFRRQHPMDRFILDFYCPEKRLAIEVDGGIHLTQQTADRERQSILQSMGIRVVRVSAALVESNLPLALERIRRAIYPSPRPTGEGSREARG